MIELIHQFLLATNSFQWLRWYESACHRASDHQKL